MLKLDKEFGESHIVFQVGERGGEGEKERVGDLEGERKKKTRNQSEDLRAPLIRGYRCAPKSDLSDKCQRHASMKYVRSVRVTYW